jgi:hypothetical protein
VNPPVAQGLSNTRINFWRGLWAQTEVGEVTPRPPTHRASFSGSNGSVEFLAAAPPRAIFRARRAQRADPRVRRFRAEREGAGA